MSHSVHDLLHRTRFLIPWLVVAAVVAVVVPSWMTGGDLPTPAWQIVLVVLAAAAIAISRIVHHVPLVYGLVVGTAIVHLVASDIYREPARPLTWPEIMGDLAVAIGLVCALVHSAVRRDGRLDVKYAVEVVVVLIGTSIATWVVLTEPLLDQGESPSRALLASAFLPLNALVAAFVVDLWNDGLRSNRSMQFAATAAVAYLAAATYDRVLLVDAIDRSTVLPASLYSIAAALVLAAIAHPDFRHHLASPDDRPAHEHTNSRLLMMGASVLLAVTLMVVVAPSGTMEIVVRETATVLLIALVVVRLAIALREHEMARRSLQRRIYRDDLTGLPTRTRFVEMVTDVLESNWRTEQHPTVIHFNLDRFKNINDTFGHHGANTVLVEIARRLETAALSFGGQTARLGGDDFAIIEATSRSTDDAIRHAETIRAAFAAPVTVDDASLFVTASIGVAMVPPKRSLTAEEIIRRADIANHRAKQDGANRVAVFDESMQANVAKRMDVEHALHGAIGRQEMRLYHQPIVDITTGRVSGFEALIRWQRADGSILSPAGVISIAEDTGIICELGAWALHDALHELRTWIDAGVVEPTTTMSVNVSPRQIADPNFTEVVRDALAATGVPAHLLWIEMTESMMLEEPELAEHTLRDIRAMGVQLALDDFGTGFSSLSLLQNFPIQRIKIDRAFVQGIADNTNDRSLVRTIVAMAHSMGLDLVAEGVETVHQLQCLRELGCNKAQGFLISHPVPAPAMGSTMTALAELTQLSLFQPSPAMVRREDAPIAVPTLTSSGMLGIPSRGPIGQPIVSPSGF
jgi:diguanylate cyclase (GGDEF)-like protein